MATTFDVRVRIDAPVDAVAAALTDPGFYATLGELPAIDEPEVLHVEGDGHLVRLRVRYRFAADLPAAARRIVDAGRLTWVDETVVDLSDQTARFRIVPEHYADRLEAEGTYALTAEGGGTLQHLSGAVHVRAALVGRMAERGIVRGLTENLAAEGRLIERWVAGAAGSPPRRRGGQAGDGDS